MSRLPDSLDGDFIRRVARAAWPEYETAKARERLLFEEDARAILQGKPTPTRSRAERESVEAAAARLQKETR
jgi:hypothetical protein